MLLVTKAACSGTVFMLLALGISGPRPAPAPQANPSKAGPVVDHPNDVKKVQELLQDKGDYRGEVDGVAGLRTRASIRAYQAAENLPVTGQIEVQTANKLGVKPESLALNGDETPKVKPSAGIKWANGSRRANKTSRSPVKTDAVHENSPN